MKKIISFTLSVFLLLNTTTIIQVSAEESEGTSIEGENTEEITETIAEDNLSDETVLYERKENDSDSIELVFPEKDDMTPEEEMETEIEFEDEPVSEIMASSEQKACPSDLAVSYDEERGLVVTTDDTNYLANLTDIRIMESGYSFCSDATFERKKLEINGNEIIVNNDLLYEFSVGRGTQLQYTYNIWVGSNGYVTFSYECEDISLSLKDLPEDLSAWFDNETGDFHISTNDIEYLEGINHEDDTGWRMGIWLSENGNVFRRFEITDNMITISAEEQKSRNLKYGQYDMWVISSGYVAKYFKDICFGSQDIKDVPSVIVSYSKENERLEFESTDDYLQNIDQIYLGDGGSLFKEDYGLDEAGILYITKDALTRAGVPSTITTYLYISSEGYPDYRSFAPFEIESDAKTPEFTVVYDENGDLNVCSEDEQLISALYEDAVYSSKGWVSRRRIVLVDRVYGRGSGFYNRGGNERISLVDNNTARLSSSSISNYGIENGTYDLLLEVPGYLDSEYWEVEISDNLKKLTDEISIYINENNDLIISSDNKEYLSGLAEKSSWSIRLFQDLKNSHILEKDQFTYDGESIIVSDTVLNEMGISNEEWKIELRSQGYVSEIMRVDMSGFLISYRINYTLNGGSLPDGQSNPVSYNAETETFTLINPSKHGYTFTGWTGTKLTGPTLEVTVSKGSYGDRSYIANYKANTYAISYELNGGTNDISNITSHSYDEEAFTLLPATRDHYTFDGWYLNDERIMEIPSDLDEDITLEARWTIISYSIFYDLDGGSLGEGENNPDTYNFETESFTLCNPVKHGYTFIGWTGTDLDDLTLEVTVPTGSEGNREYIAHYQANTYTITYVLGGGTNDENNISSHVYDEEPFILLPASRDYYTFDGWYLNDEKIMEIPSDLDEDITLVAKWIVVDYEITYILNGGVNHPDNPAGYNYETEAIILLDPSRTGYLFGGWYSEEAFENRVLSIEQNSHGDITLYAKWTPIRYTVVFDSNNEDHQTIEQSFIYDEAQKLTKNGFEAYRRIFTGWSSAKDGAAEYEDEKEVVNLSALDGDIVTLYAVWEYKYQTLAPYADIESGSEVEKGSKVSLHCDTPDSLIYFTLDGSIPNEESTVFEDAIVINKDTVITAYAVSEGFGDSEIVTFEFTVKEEDFGDILPEDLEYKGITMPEEIPEGLWISALNSFIYDPTVKSCVYDAGELRVYYGKVLLNQGADYTVKYTGNTKVGIASVTFTGKENYVGTLTEKFEILPAVLNDDNTLIILNKDSFIYNGKQQRPSPTVKYKGVTLKNKTDYTLAYVDTDISSNTYQEGSVTITFKSNYEGSVSRSFKVFAKESLIPVSSLTVSGIKNYTYTGQSIQQDETKIVVKDGKKTLEQGKDYILDYLDNTDAGTAYLIIKGTEEHYSGTLYKSFKISPIKLTLKNTEISGLKASYDYDPKSPIEPAAVLSYDGNELVLNKDYSVSFKNNSKAGTATITFKGINNYSGSFAKSFKINKLDFDVKMFTFDASYRYEKGGSKPLPETELVYNKDYTLSYQNNTKAGSTAIVTVKGKGNYSGTLAYNFKVTAGDLSNVSLSVSDKAYSTKAGAWKSVPALTDVNGKKLKAGTDYESPVYTYEFDTVVIDGSVKEKPEVFRNEGEEVQPKDILPVNTIVKVTVRGKGNFEGSSISGEYRIAAGDISKATVSIPVQYYTGKPVTLSKSDITVKLNKQALSAKDYEIVSYVNNTQKGTAKVVLQGKGNYGGTKTVSFKIVQRSLGITIRFHGNGATSGSMKDQLIYKNSALSANAYKKTEDGKARAFLGWSLTPDGQVEYSNKQVYEYSIFKAGTDVDLYAKWE